MDIYAVFVVLFGLIRGIYIVFGGLLGLFMGIYILVFGLSFVLNLGL